MSADNIARGLALKAQASRDFDVIVVGATEAGVFAAIDAARIGAKVLLTSDNERLGWMTGWGINLQDVEPAKTPGVLGGLTYEFFRDLAAREIPERTLVRWWRAGGYGRPSWYRRAFRKIIAHPNLTIIYNAEIASVEKTGAVTNAITFSTGDNNAGRYTARVFVEGSSCGDLNQRVLASISIGREGAAAYGEPATIAGVKTPLIWDGPTTVDPYVTPGVPESGLVYGVDPSPVEAVGTGDGRVMAFGRRLFITSVAADKQAFPAPDMTTYSAAKYELLGRAMAANPSYYGHASLGLSRIFQFYDVSGTTTGTAMGPTFIAYTDLNSGGPMSLNYPDNLECLEYVTASYARRAEIKENAEQWVKGLFYWLLNSGDPRIPASIVTALSNYGLSNKELREYGGFSPQFYEREGARAVGDYVMKHQDALVGSNLPDTIAYLFYGFDSHAVRRVVVNGAVYVEGTMLNPQGTNYGSPIPMRVLFPKAAECTNLVCASQPSVSQVVWCSLRAIPTMMMIGSAAGVVAAIAALEGINVQDVPVTTVQKYQNHLRTADGSVVDTSGAFAQGTVTTTGTWTTANSRFGFIGSSYLVVAGPAAATIKFAPFIYETAAYEVFLAYPPADSVAAGDQGRATNLPVTVSHAGGTTVVTVDQQFGPGLAGSGGRWESLGVYTLRRGQPSADFVLLDATSANGRVTASAIKWPAARSSDYTGRE